MQQLKQLQATALLEPVVRTPQECEDTELLKAVQRGMDIACTVQSHNAHDKRKARLEQMSTVTITMTRPRAEGLKVVYTLQLSCMEQNEVFCARDDEDNRLVVFVDDGSEVTIIRQSAISKEWELSEGEHVTITGIGEKTDKHQGTKASTLVTVPLRLRGVMEQTWVTGYIVSDAVMPDGVDVLVGKPAIKDMGIKTDSRNMRMEFSEIKTEAGIPLVVNTMPLEKQLDIIDAPALRVLDICGGGRNRAVRQR